MRIANKDAHRSIANFLSFKGNNLRGYANNKHYVVYSYNTPILLYKRGTWFKTMEKYSPTTSKHLTQCTYSIEAIFVPEKFLIEELNQCQ